MDIDIRYILIFELSMFDVLHKNESLHTNTANIFTHLFINNYLSLFLYFVYLLTHILALSCLRKLKTMYYIIVFFFNLNKKGI